MADDVLDRLVEARTASRIWERDVEVFAPPGSPPERVRNVEQRLGWLTAPIFLADRAAELANFAHDCWDDQIRRVYVLGMGGSSLCAEVIQRVLPEPPHAPQLAVLDTTDERTIRDVTDALSPPNTLVLVASKSGATLEMTTLEQHFWKVMSDALGDRAGRHFVAITDPGTPLVARAEARGYRETFVNTPNIGGRYSALSLFGLVPAALLRHPVDALLRSANGMAERCRADSADNPGLALGAFIASAARAGRDKLTLLADDHLESLGVWIEQLVAESTGKHGGGVLPVVGEPVARPSEYGDDRAFVLIAPPGPGELRDLATRLRDTGHPVFEIDMTPDGLGGEFFRWEFATAVAGSVLGVNPFDEPNVAAAKRRTDEQLETRRRKAAFKIDPPLERGHGYSRRERNSHVPQTGDVSGYVAILDYLPHEPKRAEVIAKLRAAIRRRTLLATTYGVGPRYLHSTGQYHKGGPNTGLFLMFTAVDESVTAIPGTDYTFSALKFAQALGDFDALAAAGRHVVHYHIEDPSADYSSALEGVLKSYR